MASASLKSRIDKLINRLGETPPLTAPQIRGSLTQFSTIADALESGQSSADADARIKQLESELQAERDAREADRRNLQSQLGNLQSELDAAKKELRRAQNQEDENQPLSTLDRRILEHLDKCGADMTDFIAKAVTANEWAVRELLERLRLSGFLECDGDEAVGLPGFFLTKKAKAWLAKHRDSHDEPSG